LELDLKALLDRNDEIDVIEGVPLGDICGGELRREDDVSSSNRSWKMVVSWRRCRRTACLQVLGSRIYSRGFMPLTSVDHAEAKPEGLVSWKPDMIEGVMTIRLGTR